MRNGTSAVSVFKKGMVVRVEVQEFLWRPVTKEDMDEWEADPHSHTIGDDGESRLPPRHSYLRSDGVTVYKITKSRVVALRSYSSISGCAEVMDSDGNLWWVERRHLL